LIRHVIASEQSAGMVGRAAELAELTGLIDRVQTGRAGGVWLVGAPGIGKTRLLGEAMQTARDRNLEVGWAACLPLTTTLPFDPIHAALRSLGQHVPGLMARSPRELFNEVRTRLEQIAADGRCWCASMTCSGLTPPHSSS
jgi:adenylate cyclase